MHRKDLNFKSIIIKVLFIYLGVYIVALILRYNYDFESLLSNFQYTYLILMNLISISLGLPLAIIFDIILIKFFGLYYVLFFSPLLTFLGIVQILILRKINFKLTSNKLFFKYPRNNNLYKFFEKVSFKPLYILLIRTFPILPFFLGSYFIAFSKSKIRAILINSFLGSYFYYLLLFLIIGKA
ncbi:hypothetical protein CVS24_00145 [Prochlorococcus marinus str. XMU1419]|nr:hypothetical protein [Prochlorococcus marinus str. XMU1419]